MKRSLSLTIAFAYIALATTLTIANVKTGLAQSPMDFQSMISDGNFSATENDTTMPFFRMGVLAMPIMCTSPTEMLDSLSMMLENSSDRQIMQDMIMQEMLSSANNVTGTEAQQELQQAMQMVICTPSLDQNTTNSLFGMGT